MADNNNSVQPGNDPLCIMGEHPDLVLPPGLDPNRESAIQEHKFKWMNGTVIHYYLIPSADAQVSQTAVVKWAFERWTKLEIGLRFAEVSDPLEAELRIAFDYARRKSSSWIGTYNLKIKPPSPTMQFGWDLTTEWGHATAIHEIGHAIGLKHEHQNPNAGIVWDEPAVLKYYKTSQGWTEAEIRSNVIDKLNFGDITATSWDVESIMHYPIERGLIKDPEEYRSKSTPRNIDFSKQDISFIKTVYPSVSFAPALTLEPMRLIALPLESGSQSDLSIFPNGTRDYEIRTVGKSDARIVVFEERDGELRYIAADDDSAEERNAFLCLRLVKGRNYVIKVRLHFAYGGEGFGVMMI